MPEPPRSTPSTPAHVWAQIRSLGLRPEVGSLADYERLVSVGFLAANDYLKNEASDLLESRHCRIVHWLMFEAVHAWAGEFRKPGEVATVGGFISAEAQRIELEFLLLREQSRTWPEEEEPRPRDASRIAVILAFQHIRFERIHPFRDGNGRVGRLLLTASLRQRFQSATLYVDWAARKTEYMDAMKAASRGDLAPLANILLQACGRGPLATPYYWSRYRVAPRMLEHDEGTTLEQDLEWSRVEPTYWARHSRTPTR